MTALRDAAEAVIAAAATSTIYTPVEPLALRQALDALRAALAAEDAWRARAEAAVEVMEADAAAIAAARQCRREGEPEHATRLTAFARAEDAAIAARRRYEETCRAPL